MRLAISDLELLLAYMKRRSADIGLTLTLDGHELRATFDDIDGQILTATIYDLDSSRIARLTKTENLNVSFSSLGRGT